MQDVTLAVTLKLQGPILTHSTAPGSSHLSSPFARNHDGRYYIPGSLVKGRLREAWTELESVAGSFLQVRCGLTKEQLLGEASGNQQNDGVSTEPRRGRLHFENFEDKKKTALALGQERVLYRVKLDEARGSVVKGAYQVIEAPYAAGEEASFVGHIRLRVGDAEKAKEIKECIQIGLRWITNVGANCNVGFGRLLDVQVTAKEDRSAAPQGSLTATGAERIELEITPQAPFCISRKRVANNLFESEIMIPGAVLKGCVAHTWRTLRGDEPDGEITPAYDPARRELCEHFPAIRFTHAFPAIKEQQRRPVRAPLSLVRAHDVFDVAFFDKPILIGKGDTQHETKWTAPAFDIDWKYPDLREVQQQFGWANPKRELRVRTAIDANRRRAKDEQLFAYEMIVPEDIVWHSSVDLAGITDLATRLRVEEQLLELLAYGLSGLGKTKTQATVNPKVSGSAPPISLSHREPHVDPQDQRQLWIVTLQTPAILCDSSQVNNVGLLEAYRQAWNELSSSSVELKHCFARQSLSGGYYFYRKFMKPDEYYPYLITDAGTVFVVAAVKGKESEAQKCIDDWLAHGLPLPSFTLPLAKHDDLPRNDWRNCPYLREGGYGEAAVNLDVHLDKRPQPQEVKQL